MSMEFENIRVYDFNNIDSCETSNHNCFCNCDSACDYSSDYSESSNCTTSEDDSYSESSDCNFENDTNN